MSRGRGFDYQTLSEFRYQIRKFIKFSEDAARNLGLNSQQHQMLLALKGLPDSETPTIGVLAERLQVRHHTAVELLDRLVDRGFVVRARDPRDRRSVLVHITARGEVTLRTLTRMHRKELHNAGPLLLAALRKLVP
jgi:DNA-binding MarR family transcriptional regulator